MTWPRITKVNPIRERIASIFNALRKRAHGLPPFAERPGDAGECEDSQEPLILFHALASLSTKEMIRWFHGLRAAAGWAPRDGSGLDVRHASTVPPGFEALLPRRPPDRSVCTILLEESAPLFYL